MHVALMVTGRDDEGEGVDSLEELICDVGRICFTFFLRSLMSRRYTSPCAANFGIAPSKLK